MKIKFGDVNNKLEKVWKYRTAKVFDRVFSIELDSEQEAALRKILASQFDNHIVFKFSSSDLYYWYTDGKLYVGRELVEGEY